MSQCSGLRGTCAGGSAAASCGKARPFRNLILFRRGYASPWSFYIFSPRSGRRSVAPGWSVFCGTLGTLRGKKEPAERAKDSLTDIARLSPASLACCELCSQPWSFYISIGCPRSGSPTGVAGGMILHDLAHSASCGFMSKGRKPAKAGDIKARSWAGTMLPTGFYVARLRGLGLPRSLTHSLRCGLNHAKSCRQLRWLGVRFTDAGVQM